MIGETINNYLIERKLGSGGMGDVYYAKHNKVDREVAIKVLHSHLFQNESIHNRFKNEANALIKLNHPNIVKIFDYVEQENFACLIMEYINGYTLDVYITKFAGPLPTKKAVHIMSAVLEAVQYAHDNKIYHRDIKPANIMISEDGSRVRIMDFGIAKLTDSKNYKTTHANVQLGTPFYMSPEQIKGMEYTRMSDIYSLGVTLFEMVTGKCPYQNVQSLFELQSKIVNEPLPLTSNYYPNVNPNIQNAIIKATKKESELRFQSCNEFKQFIQELDSTVIANDFIIPGNIKQDKEKRRRKIFISTGLSILAIFVLALVLMNLKPELKENKPGDSSKIFIPPPRPADSASGNTTNQSENNRKVVVQDSNIALLNRLIERKPGQENFQLSQNLKAKLERRIGSKDHILTPEELRYSIDSLFIPKPLVKFPTDYQIKRDFKASVSGMKELCRMMLDDFDSQVHNVTVEGGVPSLNKPPAVLFIKVRFIINDPEDPTDTVSGIKTLKYNKTGLEYHFSGIS